MGKNIRGKNILRKLALGLLACLLLPACEEDEEDRQEILPQRGDSKKPGVEDIAREKRELSESDAISNRR